MDPQLASSYAAARDVTRQHAASFYYCSLVLPPERRRSAYAVYAFCRYVDDLIDNAAGDETALYAARESLHEDLPEIIAGRPIGKDTPWEAAFSDTVRRHELPARFFEDLIHGVCLDARATVQMENWRELREYSYYVAGVVGLIMARLFDLQDERGEEAAVCLGVAMQLTNICRDVGEDLEKGRIYLPRDEMEAFGVREEDLREGRVTPEYRSFMAHQLDRARTYYLRAEEGIPLLGSKSGRFCVWLMRYVYAGIHRRIERQGYDNLNQRARTSFLQKLRLTIAASRDMLRPRPVDPEIFRHSGLELSHTP